MKKILQNFDIIYKFKNKFGNEFTKNTLINYFALFVTSILNQKENSK